MPELPDIELYRLRLAERLVGAELTGIQFANPFVLRSVSPKPDELLNRPVAGVERLGKRIVIALEGNAFVVLHLMIAGRLQWKAPCPPPKRLAGKMQIAEFRFTTGQLLLVETSTRKRASVHLVEGRENLVEHNRQGLHLATASVEEFGKRLTATNRTLKRALTDPRTFDGIGNAYSDEILFHGRLSPVRLTSSLKPDEIARLYHACRDTLTDWTARLQVIFPEFPKPAEITAFRPDFAVHGRFNEPCPGCGAPVQRIVYAENETNYCARCQNEGRLLADRSLSQLLKGDWPKTLEEMLGG